MTLELVYANGQLAALERYKLGWPAATDPTVAGSAVLRAKSAPDNLSQDAQARLQPPTTPHQLSQIFDAHEQGETRSEPKRKLSSEMCTSCRKDKHYGSCEHPRAIPTKVADFNIGMHGSDPTQGDNPSTSPHYHSAVSSISSLGRSSDGRPPDEQAASGFADLFRHQGIRDTADQPGRMYGGLNKVAGPEVFFKKKSALGLSAIQYFAKNLGTQGGIDFLDKHHYRQQGIPQSFQPGVPVARQLPTPAAPPPVQGPSSKVVVDPSLFHPPVPPVGQSKVARKLADFFTNMPGAATHSMHEQRGPSVNPYEERLTVKSPPVGWGDEGEQRINRAFDQIDCAADSTGIEDASKGQPSGGPAVLG
jgi:hypothetical protein